MKTMIWVIMIVLFAALPCVHADTPDQMTVILGFTVTIDNAGVGLDPDSAWETCSGGSLNIEVVDSSCGTDRIGHRYTDTLTFENLSIRRTLWDFYRKILKGKNFFEKWKIIINILNKGLYSLRFEGYNTAGDSIFKFSCREVDLSYMSKNRFDNGDDAKVKMTITYDFQTYTAEIVLHDTESMIHLNLYDCEPEIPMAFGDPTVPLLQNLASVEVMIDKAEECTCDLDCEFGYECDMGICVESECHGGSIDGLVMPKLCGPGMECFYADPIAEDHGNGTCILLPAE